jgi:hypothetical protein
MPAHRGAIALLVSSTVATSAHAEEEIRVLPCRPTISCSADIVPPGAVEIEFGYGARRVHPGGFIHTQPLLVKLTISEWLQVQVGTNGYVFTSGQAPQSLRFMDDISYGLKAHVVDQSEVGPSLAVSASVSVPTPYRNDLFPFAYDASFWGYASKDLGPLHLDVNGGLNVWQFDIPQRSLQPFVSVAATLSLPLGLGAMLESYWFDYAGPIALRDAGILWAGSYSPSPSVLFDAGVDVSLFPSTREYTVFAGVTFIPARLWEPWSGVEWSNGRRKERAKRL